MNGLFASGQKHERVVFVLLEGPLDDLLDLRELLLVQIVNVVLQQVVEFHD